MKRKHVEALLLQALETELGGERIYEAALRAAVHPGLESEWTKYLEETREHQEILRTACEAVGVDPDAEHPARGLVRGKADALVASIDQALELLDAEGAQLVAGEAVVEAETKDHLNWSLLKHVAENGPKEYRRALQDVVAAVHPQEGHHLFHTQGWTRELWLGYLGFAAALPPPEEVREVETPIGASRAEHQRDRYT